MKKIICATVLLASCISAFSQKKPATPSMPAIPDVNKLMNMTPAGRESYTKKMARQAADYADANNLPISKATIPGYDLKPPVKNLKRLSQLPSQPPAKAWLLSDLDQSLEIFIKKLPASQVAAVKNTVATLPVVQVHPKAVTEFYSGNREGGLLMMMLLVKKAPDSLLYVNNLAAMYNLLGGGHKAVPLLQYCLQKVPNSSMALGNIGQSYFQLGDMTKAAAYFQQCLKIDSLHSEANHSMGMIYAFRKNFEMARHCFARELTGCVRKSTLGICKKINIKINLRDVYNRRKKREGLPEKDFFDELKLNLFTLPTFPENSKAYLRRKQELAELAASVQAEQQFWMNKALKISASYASVSAQDQPGIYTDLVEAMLEELHEEFTPEYLNNYTEKDISDINTLAEQATKTLNEVYCSPAPAGSSISVQEAYAVKCCEEKMRPLADGYVTELGGIVRPIFTVGLLRWKTYINKLTNILHLDPSPANAMLLCNTVAGYFTYFNNALLYYNMGDLNNYLVKCKENYIPGSAGKVIESNRLWNLSCAPWMNVEVEFFSAALKADCNKFVIEGGAVLMGAYEHEFKSHQSTLLLGPGMKGDIGGIINGEVKAQLFLTFDENLGFSDVGIKRTIEAGISGTPVPILGDKIKIGGNLAGIEVSDKIGIMSGHSAEIEWKGMLNQSMEWLNAAK